MDRMTYHLYHHQPDPLPLESVNVEAWLVNNGVNYSVVATLQARTPEEAYQALQEKHAQGGRMTRCVELQTGNLIRETLPGDVLLGEKAAWMIMAGAQLQPVLYKASRPWKSYAHNATVRCMSWAPNGEHIAAIDSEVRIHNLSGDDDRYLPPTYRRHGSVTGYALAWAPSGTRIASGGRDGEVHVWKPILSRGYSEAATGSIVVCRTEEAKSGRGEICCIAWAPDSRSLLAGRDTGDIVQWDAVTGECLHIFQCHQDDVKSLAYAPDGTCVASGSEDGTIRIWRVGEDPDQDVVCHQNEKVSSLAWSPDSTILVSACKEEDRSLHFWDPLTGEPGEVVPLSVYSTKILSIDTVSWSPDGRYIVAGCDDGTLQIVDVARRRHIFTYRTGEGHSIHTAVWSPDGKWIASGGSEQWGGNSRVRIWSANMDTDMPSLRQNEEG